MIATTHRIGRRLKRLAPATLVVTLLTAGAVHANPGSLVNPSARGPVTGEGCTMASPARRATIEAHLLTVVCSGHSDHYRLFMNPTRVG